MKIYIDAGHNSSGYDTGAEGNGLREQDVTFEIAQKLKENLNKYNIEVMCSRNKLTDNLGTDLNSSLFARAKMANDWGADLFISLHCNSHSSSLAHGTEVYTYSKNSKVYCIAQRICAAISKDLGIYNRGTKCAEFAVLKNTSMPAMLIECAFISNVEDAEKLKNNKADFAKSISKVIADYYGLAKKNVQKESFKYEKIGATHIVYCNPLSLGGYIADKRGYDIDIANFVNGGYFMLQADGTTYGQHILVDNGKVLLNNPTHRKPVTTLCVFYDGAVQIKKILDITKERGLKFAISGASLDDYKSEGFEGRFSDIARCTQRTYIGYRKSDNKIVICYRPDTDLKRAKETFKNLGVEKGMTLDGGASCCMRVDGKWKAKTARQINSIIMWE